MADLARAGTRRRPPAHAYQPGRSVRTPVPAPKSTRGRRRSLSGSTRWRTSGSSRPVRRHRSPSIRCRRCRCCPCLRCRRCLRRCPGRHRARYQSSSPCRCRCTSRLRFRFRIRYRFRCRPCRRSNYCRCHCCHWCRCHHPRRAQHPQKPTRPEWTWWSSWTSSRTGASSLSLWSHWEWRAASAPWWMERPWSEPVSPCRPRSGSRSASRHPERANSRRRGRWPRMSARPRSRPVTRRWIGCRFQESHCPQTAPVPLFV